MTLLSSLVFCSTSYKGRIFDDYCSLPKIVKDLLQSVSKGQRHKFKKYGIVPVPVLEVLWFFGFMPGEEPPTNGMKIKNLIEYLQDGSYATDERLGNGKWLRDKIICEELIGVKRT